MESKRPIRSFLAVGVVAVFAACSGGGGSGAVSPSGGGGNSGGNTSSQSMATKEQSVASSALSISGNSLDVDQFGASGSVTISAIQRAIASRSEPDAQSSPDTCQNGVEFSQSASGNGQYSETIEFFYNSTCTQPRKLVTLDISFSSSTGTIAGTEELWDQSGNVVDYKTDNGTFDFSGQQVTQISMQRTAAAQPSAAPFAQNGFTCIFNSGSAIDCGDGVVATINSPQLDPHIYATTSPSATPSMSPSPSPAASPTPYEIGFTGTVTGTQSSPSPSPSPNGTPNGGPRWGWNPQSFELQLTVNGTGYTGAAQSMTLASATAPAWSITGGTQVSTLSGSATIGFDPSGMMSNANITLDDSADGLTITLTSISQGGLTGNVTNTSGQTVATVTVDANGDGAIDYTSGATAQIRDWVILSS